MQWLAERVSEVAQQDIPDVDQRIGPVALCMFLLSIWSAFSVWLSRSPTIAHYEDFPTIKLFIFFPMDQYHYQQDSL